MKELREIGKPLEAKDTSKNELINEILAKEGDDTETGKLLEMIGMYEGDLVQTYELMPRIKRKLEKLRELEKIKDKE